MAPSPRLQLSDPKAAHDIARVFERHARELNRSLEVAQDRLPTDEFLAYRAAVATILGHSFDRVLEPIYVQYPNLEPNELRRSDERPRREGK